MKTQYKSMNSIPFIPVICLFFCCSLWGVSGGDNLLTNSGFEYGNTNGWERDFWNKEGIIEIVKDYVHQGRYSLRISSPAKENDIRLTQLVKVAPDTYYKFSGWIAAKDIQENKVGANICIMSGFNYAGNMSGTRDWEYFELFFKTSKKQRDIKIAARLGMYYNTVRGTAYFDDLRLEKLDYTPEQSIILKDPGGSQQENDKKVNKNKTTQTRKRKMKNTDPVFNRINLFLILQLIALGLGLVGVNVYITIRREKKNVDSE